MHSSTVGACLGHVGLIDQEDSGTMLMSFVLQELVEAIVCESVELHDCLLGDFPFPMLCLQVMLLGHLFHVELGEEDVVVVAGQPEC